VDLGGFCADIGLELGTMSANRNAGCHFWSFEAALPVGLGTP
jgi:hypothetical protein